MTDLNEHPADENEKSVDPSAGQNLAASGEADAATADHPADSVQAAADPDELPEDEELTPELVEEEAIRGDFMLRWAAILLATLFGFSQIQDTRTLVHVRSGDHMRANGFLPDRTDPFSFVNEGQAVSNVSWAFDHVVSGVYQLGGETGLTVFKALIAIVIGYLLSVISVPGLPTWWSSICGVIAIAACSSDLIPITDLATLLFLVILLRWLHQHFEGLATGLQWKIPVLIAVWANFDPRAWLGVVAVAAFAAGTSISRRENTVPDSPRSLWPIALCSIAALAVNPFPIASLLSVLTVYTVEYPLLQSVNKLTTEGVTLLDGRTEAFSLLNTDVFSGFEFAYVAGLTMLVLAIAVVIIAKDRRELPWVMLLAVFAVLAVLRLHELAAASLVAAVVAGTVAQRWYRRVFPQEYSVATSEVMFSRGGRAATVFAFALLGFLIVADRLPTRSPVGVGFESDLKTTMVSLGEQLERLPEDARILHTKPEQGDILIWHGRKSVVDSRATAFGRAGSDESIIGRHQLMLTKLLRPGALQPEESPTGEQLPPPDTNWQDQYKQWQITHVMPRLAPPGAPDYVSFGQLSADRAWVLADVGASAAFFEYVGPNAASDVIQKKTINISRRAFIDAEPIEPEQIERVEFARDPNFYQKYVYRKRPVRSAALREAEHYVRLIPPRIGSVTEAEYLLSLPMLAVRRAGVAVAADPLDPNAYYWLGKGYQQLGMLENIAAQIRGGAAPEELRYFQAIMALRQAAQLAPEDSRAWSDLFDLYHQRGRVELASECLNRYLDLEGEAIRDEQFNESIKLRFEIQRGLNDHIETVHENLASTLEATEFSEEVEQHAAQKLQIIQELAGNGLVTSALKLCQENADILSSIPHFDILRGNLMLESGDLENGYELLRRAAVFARERPELFQATQWYGPVAIASLGKGEYLEAVDTWNDQLRQVEQIDDNPMLTQGLLTSLPLVAEVETRLGKRVPAWPLLQCEQIRIPLNAIPRGRTEPRFMIAMAYLEEGNLNNARVLLQSIVADAGNVEYRPLAIVYLSHLKEDAQEFIESTTLNLWEEWSFEDPDSTTEDTSAAEDSPSAESSAASAPKPASEPQPANDAQSGSDAQDAESGAKESAASPDASTDAASPAPQQAQP